MILSDAADPFWNPGAPEDLGLTAAQGRLAGRTYATGGFSINQPQSRDFGQPARFVYKVFDVEDSTELSREGEEWVVSQSAGGRVQIKLLIAREAGAVKELWVQKVPAPGSPGKVRDVLNLKRADAEVLIELLRTLDLIPVQGAVPVRVDDALVRDLFANPASLVEVYKRDPDRFRELITDDVAAQDVVAIAHRRQQVDRFRKLLNDPAYFRTEEEALPGRGTEHVWQNFFEQNPWILGVTLSGQLFTSWNPDRLRQAVTGRSVHGVGKEADALLRTAGRVRAIVFAEFKNHTAELLSKDSYRSGCWAPSEDLSGGVAQAQGTVHRAVLEIGDRLADTTEDGSDIPGRFSYLIRPRSYLIIGRLNELIGSAGGDHQDRIRSFELYRRHLQEPEVITYDELLARAEWFVGPGADSRS